MKNFEKLDKIKTVFLKKENVSKYLKSINDEDDNSVENILISYDLQSGTYVKEFYHNEKFKSWVDEHTTTLANKINSLGEFKSIIEIGVGEGTTLTPLINKLKPTPHQILGFDISWSRLKFAKEFLSDFGFKNVTLFTANLFNIPLLDNSVDIVYTSHSLEPNGGKEEEAISELYRITNKYLILLEPSYEFANEDGKKRMEELGYVTNLYQTVKKLGYKVIEYKLFESQYNPLNPTSVLIIEKPQAEANDLNLRCPISLTKLNKHDDSLLYSKDSFLGYPIINGIPCLIKENSILVSHLLTTYNDIKK